MKRLLTKEADFWGFLTNLFKPSPEQHASNTYGIKGMYPNDLPFKPIPKKKLNARTSSKPPAKQGQY